MPPKQPRKGSILGSPTRRKFMARKRAKQQARKDDAEHKLTHVWCQGQRIRKGKMATCMFELKVGRPPHEEGKRAVCRLCNGITVFDGAKWVSAEAYEAAEAKREAAAWGPHVLPATPEHDSNCVDPGFDLSDLRPGPRREMAPGSMGAVGRPWIDGLGHVRHWCREAKRG